MAKTVRINSDAGRLTLPNGRTYRAGIMPEIQQVAFSADAAGTYTITHDGNTTSAIDVRARPSDVLAELVALTSIEADEVKVWRGPAEEDSLGQLQFDWEYQYTLLPLTLAFTGIALDEIVDIDVDATAGNFKITVEGQETGNIAFDASTATITTDLEALSTVAVGDVVVTGGPGQDGGGTPYRLTFQNNLAATLVTVTTDPALLTGGGSTADVTVIVEGHAANINEPEVALDTSGLTAGSAHIKTVQDGNSNGEIDVVITDTEFDQINPSILGPIAEGHLLEDVT